jgi:NADPH:quinone reductase-like Zn-dependent oxidoreductase
MRRAGEELMAEIQHHTIRPAANEVLIRIAASSLNPLVYKPAATPS